MQEPVQNVTPVAQVSVQQPTINTINNNQIQGQTIVEPNQQIQITPKDPENSNQIIADNSTPKKTKKKVNKSTILLILLFIFLFGFVMFMPNINDFIDKLRKDVGLSEIEKQAKEIEEQQNAASKKNTETTNTKEEKTSTLKCTSLTEALGNYERTTVEEFEYNKNNQVISSKKIITYTFTTVDSTYEQLKVQCEDKSLKYLGRDGYSMICSSNDTEVTMGDEFDLEIYKVIYDGDTQIEANATYKEDISAVSKRLKDKGYTCE